MKVKNIAFSGFMAAILMGVAGAHAAAAKVSVASQAYVDGKVKTNTTAINNLSTTVTDYVASNNAAVALKADKSALDTLSGTVAANKQATDAAIAGNTTAISTLADNVYTKEAADALLAGKVDNKTLENYYTKSETYTDDRIEERISETLTSLEGGNINLGGYAKTSYVDAQDSNIQRPRQIGTELSHDVLNPARVPL